MKIKCLDSASGVSIDWVYDKLNVRLSFAFELRDMGHFGFLLPKEMILPTAHEVWEGIKAILDSIWLHNWNFNNF